MSDGSSPGGKQDPEQAADARVHTLTSELIEASGHYGLQDADRLRRAETLLGLSAVRQRMDSEALSLPEAALRIVTETVDAWSEPRGRAILRSAFGFDHGSWGSRPNRLGLLAVELGEAKNAKYSKSLNTAFTERLARDLAAKLLAGEPGSRHNRRISLVFRPVPRRCSIDFCRDEARAIRAQTGGFTPNGIAAVEIFTPSGKNANDLAGVYAYRDELLINDKGEFTWRYWWDPGMEIGIYHVRITDEETGQSIQADFEFY